MVPDGLDDDLEKKAGKTMYVAAIDHASCDY